MRVLYIKKKWIALLPIFIIALGYILRINNSVTPTFYLPVTNKVIAIDAGHGGIDPGAAGQLEKKEDDINLEIALKLRKLIEQNGGVVILTRDEDVGLYTDDSKTIREKKNEDLRNRKALVNDSNPDVFLSIHLNSFTQKQYYGAQTFYKKGCESSKKLAELIQEEFKNSLDKDNNRVPQSRDSLYLIREVEKPSVLIECGFLSNSNEEKLLNSEKYQEKIAWSIYIGLIKYFNEIEQK
ncbi:germination-specific N-acetylmuramoyl-L-alanine amidase CwlD [Gottschalkia purinilytica]|uniref:Germination-specific N-acetylmuramoyl-L-alanine amidase CwlD n=1 Tax=Gottschalkia purinilytica TaxID=1503 RepID=A0A0L0W9E5_GOTPU|nr:N-acetylmuramoyl-L-alanine amidase CwlD [Gottschalkia purinilytica]KNF08057.1 germination-specific N-acetylmuramoyl-L-alanine amidase CwlD [Gottschalkia purinilytica]